MPSQGVLSRLSLRPAFWLLSWRRASWLRRLSSLRLSWRALLFWQALPSSLLRPFSPGPLSSLEPLSLPERPF